MFEIPATGGSFSIANTLQADESPRYFEEAAREMACLQLGRRVRNLREMRGIGLNELARSADVSPGYLSQLESGQRGNPSVDVIHRLARALDVTAQYLIEPETSYDPPPVLQDEAIMLRERKYAGLSDSDREDIDELLNVKWKRRLAARHRWLTRLPPGLGEKVADLIALHGLRAVLSAAGAPSEASLLRQSDEQLTKIAQRAVDALGGSADAPPT